MKTKDYIISAIKSDKHTLKRLGIRNVGLFGSYSRDVQSDMIDTVTSIYPLSGDHKNQI